MTLSQELGPMAPHFQLEGVSILVHQQGMAFQKGTNLATRVRKRVSKNNIFSIKIRKFLTFLYVSQKTGECTSLLLSAVSHQTWALPKFLVVRAGVNHGLKLSLSFV